MNIKKLIEVSHKTAKEKGWWDGKERSQAEINMLIITELAEATEEVRAKKPFVYVSKGDIWFSPRPDWKYATTNLAVDSVLWTDITEGNRLKPEGEAIELIDAVIRVADYMGHKKYEFENPITFMSTIPYSSKDLEKLITATDSFSVIQEKLTYVARSKIDNGLDWKDWNSPLEFHYKLSQMISVDYAHSYSKFLHYVLEYFNSNDWNFEKCLRLKMDYNAQRSYRHGGKAF